MVKFLPAPSSKAALCLVKIKSAASLRWATNIVCLVASTMFEWCDSRFVGRFLNNNWQLSTRAAYGCCSFYTCIRKLLNYTDGVVCEWQLIHFSNLSLFFPNFRCAQGDVVTHTAWLNRSSILYAGEDKWSVDPRVSLVALNQDEFTIKIENVHMTDEGQYVCAVQTSSRPTTTSVHLIVQGNMQSSVNSIKKNIESIFWLTYAVWFHFLLYSNFIFFYCSTGALKD